MSADTKVKQVNFGDSALVSARKTIIRFLEKLQLPFGNERGSIYEIVTKYIDSDYHQRSTDAEITCFNALEKALTAGYATKQDLTRYLQLDDRIAVAEKIEDAEVRAKTLDELLFETSYVNAQALYVIGAVGSIELASEINTGIQKYAFERVKIRGEYSVMLKQLLEKLTNGLAKKKSEQENCDDALNIFFKALFLSSMETAKAIEGSYEHFIQEKRLDRQISIYGVTFNGFSHSKSYTAKRRERLDDFRGYPEQKKEILDFITTIKAAREAPEYDAKVQKALLLAGPTGTGKSHLARCIAGELDYPLTVYSFKDLGSEYVDGRPKNVAMALSGEGIIAIDEADSIVSQRGSSPHGRIDDQTVTVINDALDGIQAKDDERFRLVIMITNRPDIFDSALLRGGRFHVVYIGNPNEEGIADILSYYVGKKNAVYEKATGDKSGLYQNIDFKAVSSEMFKRGFSGATINDLIEGISRDFMLKKMETGKSPGYIDHDRFMGLVEAYKTSGEKLASEEGADALIAEADRTFTRLLMRHPSEARDYLLKRAVPIIEEMMPK